MTTLSTFTDFEPGELTSEKLYRNFYGQRYDSMAVINGHLGQQDISTVSTMTYKEIQTGAFSGGSQVGGTATLDYFSGGPGIWKGDTAAVTVETGPLPRGFGWFEGVGENPVDEPSRWLPVPGANMRIYLPYDAYVLILWSVTFANDSQRDTHQSAVDLFIDGSPASDLLVPKFSQSPTARRIRRSSFDAPVTIATADHIIDRYKGRSYSGHYFTPSTLTAGFHDIGLHVGASSGSGIEIKQTKIRARSLKYIYFRKGATF